MSAPLTSEEAARRLAADGPNVLPHEDRRPAFRILAAQFSSPLIGILIAAAAVSYALGERIEAAVILGIVALNAVLGFAQEYHADRALRALRRYVTRTARVWRDGTLRDMPAADLVRGDVVALEVGDLIPADLQVDEADELALDESSLTGESFPVTPTPGSPALMGSVVVGGYGTGTITATGVRTRFGRTARLLTRKPAETDFQRNLRAFSGFLLRLTVGLTLFVFVANALLGKGWFEAFIFAVALAVGITPEVLPTIVTATLAAGALRMARKKVVVKRLIAIEDLGNIDILCCDKTGTLTEGRPVLRGGVAGSTLLKTGDVLDASPSNATLLLYGALAGSAGTGIPKAPTPNPMDQAIWASDALGSHRDALAAYHVLDRNAFDFQRRRGSALVQRGDERLLVVKGATESVLAVCTAIDGEGRGGDETPAPLPPEMRDRLAARARSYEEDGIRVLAVAHRRLGGTGDGGSAATSQADERELTFVGLLLFEDPPKAGVRDALDHFVRLGVTIKILSGDSPAVARHVCREVGLAAADDQVIAGDALASLADDAFRAAAHAHTVFARVTPDQKYRLVAALREAGHVVGFLGDGVNDAPALRAADVGIAVDSGTDAAKQAADVVLLEKSLAVLGGGVVEGRTIFANVTKYLLNTMSANLGNMLTVAASSLLLAFLPLLPSQILLNNFLSDVPLLTLAADRVDVERLRRPRRWHIGLIARFMVLFGVLSAVFDLVLIGALLFVWRAEVPLFRTAWFVESACSEMVVTFAIRTRLPWYRSRPSGWLLGVSAAAAVATFLLPYTSLGARWFAFVPLPSSLLALIVAILVGYFFSAEAVKHPFFRRFEL